MSSPRSQQLLDIAVAQGEPEIEPDRVLEFSGGTDGGDSWQGMRHPTYSAHPTPFRDKADGTTTCTATTASHAVFEVEHLVRRAEAEPVQEG